MAEEDYDHHTPIHQSLIRPMLLLGCELTPIVGLGALSVIMISTSGNGLTMSVGLVLIVVGYPLLKRMARVDPYMLRVYIRHQAYRNTYEAHPSIGRPAFRPQMREEI